MTVAGFVSDSMLKSLIISFLVASVLVSPTLVVAATIQSATTTSQTTGTASLVQSLYARLQQMEAQLTVLETATSSVAVVGTATSTTAPSIFTRNLSLYATGSDVLALQQFLNTHGFLVATTGAGSPGEETSLFGLATYKALVKFQAANGLPATGYFGPETRAFFADLPSANMSDASNSAGPTQVTSSPSATSSPPINATTPTGTAPGYGGGGGPEAPSISLAAPSSGAAVGGAAVALTATVSDNVNITNVSFEVDGVTVGSTSSSPYTVSWNSKSLADGTHTLSAIVTNSVGQQATANETITTDNTSPVISSIATSTQTGSTAIFTWTTNEPATSQILYGTTTSYGSTTALNSTLSTSHSVELTGLSSATTYHLQIQSADEVGNLATTSDLTFTLSYPESGDSMLWGQRLLLGLNEAAENGSSGARYAVYQIFIGVPDWNVTNAQFAFPNFYYTAGDPAESIAGLTPLSIIGGEIWSGAPDSGGTAIEALKFSGTTTVSIAVGSTTLSDPLASTLTAGTPIYMRLIVDRGLNTNVMPLGLIRQQQNDEKWQYFSTQSAATALLSTGTLTDNTNTSSSLYKGYGPMFAVGKGWDGRKVVLLLGHSAVNGGARSQTPDGAADSRGNKVYSAMALDSSSLTGGRVSFGNIAVPGITPSQESMNPSSSDFYYRYAALEEVAAQQGGRWPFTDIFLDIAGNGGNTSASTWETNLASNIAFTRSLFPGEPIVMPTMSPNTTNLNSQFWTTLADQGFSSAAFGPGPSAPMQQVDAYILTKPNIDDAIDLTTAETAGNEDEWPVQSFSATLSTSTSAGTSTVELSAAPNVGAELVFDPGSSSAAEIVNAVASVTGSGPYFVTFTQGAALVNAHSAGATVEESPTVDGLHMSIDFAEQVKNAVVNAINSNALP
ncbi:MAG TPA: Ig-like domain-containing protein [Xanthobacteraceae bacterium]|nr:Ig-like domain-containing protein [Xanthobacteraceae bacterium]